MSVKSKVLLSEEVVNKDRRFGSNSTYYPVKIELIDGSEKTALFTLDQINIAIGRAMRNSEDLPDDGGFFNWLLG